MAPITTHLIIGEQVYPHLTSLVGDIDYGSFLLGCLLVDIHGFGAEIERRETHFADRLDKDSYYAFDKSCQNFVSQLDNILISPHIGLSRVGQSFVLGYLCHLAADENWKQYDWDVRTNQGIYLWTDLDVPGDVLLTVFDVLSGKLYKDYMSVSQALESIHVPNVFSHVSYEKFQAAWEIMKIHIDGKSTLASYLEVERQLGKDDYDIENLRESYEQYWKQAEKVIEVYFGGIEWRVDAMIQQAIDKLTVYREIFRVHENPSDEM
jgi:hypothetical protein